MGDWAALRGRDNALNAIRLVLAGTVAVSHAMILGLGDVTHTTERLGTACVCGFFGISGYLIARSREGAPFWPFLLRRITRVFPGYWVVLLVTGFVFAPVAAWLAGTSIDWVSAGQYVSRNALLVQNQVGIGETLTSSPGPYRYVWNTSLWTLAYEFGCYLALGVLFTSPLFRKPRVAGMVWASLTVASLGFALVGWPLPIALVPRLGSCFAAGVLLYALGDRLPNRGLLAGLSFVTVAMAWPLWSWAFVPLTSLPLAYLLLWLGMRLPVRVGARSDVSYGLYIYAFPVQQLLIAAGLARLGGAALAVLSLTAALPLAWVSWRFVERPASRAIAGLGRSAERSRELSLSPSGLSVN